MAPRTDNLPRYLASFRLTGSRSHLGICLVSKSNTRSIYARVGPCACGVGSTEPNSGPIGLDLLPNFQWFFFRPDPRATESALKNPAGSFFTRSLLSRFEYHFTTADEEEGGEPTLTRQTLEDNDRHLLSTNRWHPSFLVARSHTQTLPRAPSEDKV